MKNSTPIAWNVLLLGLAVPLVAAPARAQDDITSYGSGALLNNTTGDYNSAFGVNALRLNTTGSGDTAMGRGAMYKNVGGVDNTAVGYGAMYWNNTGSANVAVGRSALESNTTGEENVAVGSAALLDNIDGSHNVAVGVDALKMNTTGSANVGVGDEALWANTDGDSNVAVGLDAMSRNRSGSQNVAQGSSTLFWNQTGSGNTAVGHWALASTGVTVSYNVAIGYQSLIDLDTGNYNTAVGTWSGVFNCPGCTNTGAFGNGALATASNTIRIGNSSITQIGGIVGWSNLSDRRHKTNVKANVPGLEFITKLEPVTFNWELSKLNEGDGVEKLASDPVLGEAREAKAKKVYTGFIAQDVEAAAEECGFDFSGVVKPANENSSYHLTYAEFVVPLVKAVQEQQKEIDELRETVRALASGNQLRDGRLGKAAEQSHSQHAAMLGSWGGAMTLLGAALALLHLKGLKASGKPTS